MELNSCTQIYLQFFALVCCKCDINKTTSKSEFCFSFIISLFCTVLLNFFFFFKNIHYFASSDNLVRLLFHFILFVVDSVFTITDCFVHIKTAKFTRKFRLTNKQIEIFCNCFYKQNGKETEISGHREGKRQ